MCPRLLRREARVMIISWVSVEEVREREVEEDVEEEEVGEEE